MKYEKPTAVVISITGPKDISSVSKAKKYKRVEHYHCSQSKCHD